MMDDLAFPGREFPELRDVVPAAGGRGRPLRIWCVTPELAEFHQNGGLGTATSGLVAALRQGGHSVGVLYTGDVPEAPDSDPLWRSGVERMARAGVTLAFARRLYEPRFFEGPRQVSYACYDFLKKLDVDVIHFNDYGGNGYYATLAKRTGAAFAETTLAMTLHGVSRWAMEVDRSPVADIVQVEQMLLEEAAVAASDLCVAVSAYMARWLTARGVSLPARTYVHRNCQPALPPGPPAHLAPGGLRRIAFFGRLERRKGLPLFVEAMRRVLGAHPEIELIFLGRFSKIDGEHAAGYVIEHLRETTNPIRFLNRLDRDGALRELRRPGTLAVMPSYDENSPCAVVECQLAGVPFLACDVGGVPELIAAEDRDLVLTPPDSARLAERIDRIAREGHRGVAPDRSDASIVEGWLDLHAALAAEGAAARSPSAPTVPAAAADATPLVSVCVTHFRRPHMIPPLMAAIAAQTYPAIEIAIVDDGSGDPASAAMMAQMTAHATDRPPVRTRVIENAYLGAARNAAAALASGRYLKFQDDDNLPLPHEIETLVRAAERTGADVATCFAYQFRDTPPEAPGIDHVRYFPLGACGPLGYLRNDFGDANALVRADAFARLGGFTEDRGVGCEDYELFARCASAGGRIVCVPEPLYFYRVSADSMLQTGSPMADGLRGRRGYAGAGAEVFRALADIEAGRQLRQREQEVTWHRLGSRRLGWLHQQLMADDPNGLDAARRLAELLGLSGRVEDGFRLMLDNRSVAGALAWFSEAGMAHLEARNRDPRQRTRPILLDLAVDRDVRLLAPSPTDMPKNWQPEWPVLETRPEGLLVHPVGDAETVAVLPLAVPRGASRLAAEWMHGHAAGGPVIVSVSVGRHPASGEASARLEPGEGPTVVAVEFDSLVEARDLILRARAVSGDSFAWSIARSVRIDFSPAG